MELFSETNLKQILRSRNSRRSWAVSRELENIILQKIILQCAESLYCMHEHRFMHCDLKPESFLVTRDGDIRLIDFAHAQKYGTSFLAKIFSVKRGRVLSLNYVSPEQFRGSALTPQADIYSFGCIMFELVTGTPPYNLSSPNELQKIHISAPIPPILNANVTGEFQDIVHVAMAKNPKHRFASMWHLLQALRGSAIFKSPPEPPEAADVVRC